MPARGRQLLILSVCLLGTILYFRSRLLPALVVLASIFAQGQVTAVSFQSPKLAATGTVNLVLAHPCSGYSGRHHHGDWLRALRGQRQRLPQFCSRCRYLGYHFSRSPHPVPESLGLARSSASTRTYHVNIAGFAPPTPPPHAHRILNMAVGTWIVDNNPDVGGNCNHGSIASFPSSAGSQYKQLAPACTVGQHFVLASGCQYDDSLLSASTAIPPGWRATPTFSGIFGSTFPPARTTAPCKRSNSTCFRLYNSATGFTIFMFGSQCNYATIAGNSGFRTATVSPGWTPAHSPCRTATGTWHHVQPISCRG